MEISLEEIPRRTGDSVCLTASLLESQLEKGTQGDTYTQVNPSGFKRARLAMSREFLDMKEGQLGEGREMDRQVGPAMDVTEG